MTIVISLYVIYIFIWLLITSEVLLELLLLDRTWRRLRYEDVIFSLLRISQRQWCPHAGHALYTYLTSRILHRRLDLSVTFIMHVYVY